MKSHKFLCRINNRLYGIQLYLSTEDGIQEGVQGEEEEEESIENPEEEIMLTLSETETISLLSIVGTVMDSQDEEERIRHNNELYQQVCLSLCLSLSLSVFFCFFCLSVCLFCLFVCVCLSVCLFCLSVRLSVHYKAHLKKAHRPKNVVCILL